MWGLAFYSPFGTSAHGLRFQAFSSMSAPSLVHSPAYKPKSRAFVRESASGKQIGDTKSKNDPSRSGAARVQWRQRNNKCRGFALRSLLAKSRRGSGGSAGMGKLNCLCFMKVTIDGIEYVPLKDTCRPGSDAHTHLLKALISGWYCSLNCHVNGAEIRDPKTTCECPACGLYKLAVQILGDVPPPRRDPIIERLLEGVRR